MEHVRPTKKNGRGGVFRDSTCHWTLGYIGTRKMGNHTYMELNALLEELQISLQHQLTPLEVNVDSTEVISLLQSHYPQYSSILHECMFLLHQLGRPHVIHTCMEQNWVADKLTKHKATLNTDAPTTIIW